jgi:Holliday junction resolvase RusA-like endonuclease
MKKNSIKFILGTKGTIPSINAVYKAKMVYKYGKPIPVLYKDSVATKITEEINEQLRQIDFQEQAPWIFKKDAVFNLTIQFIFKQSFFKRDLDNLMKVVQDAIFRYFKINDSRVIELHTFKSILPEASEEKICVSLSESGSEIRFDKLEELPCPDLVYTNNQDLKEDLEKAGYQVTMDYDGDIEEVDGILWDLKESAEILHDATELVDLAWKTKLGGYSCLLVSTAGLCLESGDDLVDKLREISGGSKKIVVTDILDPTKYLRAKKKTRKSKK